MKKRIRIGIGDSAKTAKDFIDAWKRALDSEYAEAEERLVFENLETLLETLTSGRWKLLKTLHAKGPMSVRALAGEQGRDYKNVHRDVQQLERVGLIGRTSDSKVEVPWDIVEARLKLAA
jgi:predicted transcriptional regulator